MKAATKSKPTAASSAPALRLDLLFRFAEGREETDRLFSILNPSVIYQRPIPERHRIVFYVGHLEAFDWNLLREHLSLDRFHAEFDRLFAFGIDPVDGGLPTDQPSDWPSHSEVLNYRRQIRQALDAALSHATENDELVQRMNIAIEHRLMHAETLEYMFHQLPYQAKIRPAVAPAKSALPASSVLIQVPAGPVTLGLHRNSGEFGWDNEFEAHTVDVPAFAIDKCKVSNADFFEFIQAGGYHERSLWSPDDWSWKTEADIRHPVFWVPAPDGIFRFRSMFEELPLQLSAPVFVSHAEASAYAKWAGKSLPSESQWQRASLGAKLPKQSRILWDPPANGSSPDLATPLGIEDLYGTGWEWTSTLFQPFPGFQIAAAYPGYSANFFDGKHFVMKGGSTRTASCMLRPTFRNWFQAHYQYVYAGFRCVQH